ncbi:AraC family transcriptional regulator [Paenibacillus sp. sptzw28]|uniref:helix-turn-helix domain-containing protein n=1 Tax=Paenibacillus sp. sptzw28 TaxID=715179 RepID=UPI001C6EDFD5|nr:helix-turn-helix domain-containing protein [Paenibacillus sp. sptzw28]QYR22707.1 AraC family transcriptional regulator [Paenibacillus sp. sptzw28]
MKPTYKTIIRNYFHRFQADVTMTAYSQTKPGMHEDQSPDFYRFWFIHEGEGILKLNGQCYELKPGRLYLLPPGAMQSFCSGQELSIGIYWCHFYADIGDMHLFELLQLPVFVEPDHGQQVTDLFENMIKAFRSSALTRELRLRAGLLEILACYLEFCDMREQTLQQFESLENIDRVLEYIDLHLSENLVVEDLAKLAFLHPNYFIGFFKNVVGCSPIQYVNIRRMEEAKRLLEETAAAVSDVARQVGMQNHYLSRLFKRHIGLTPSRYRQIYRAAQCGAEEGGSGL